MRKTKIVLGLFILLLMVTFVSCNKKCNHNGPTPDPNPGIVTPPKPQPQEVSIGIKGSSEVKSGAESQYRAYVDGEPSNEVTWEIKEGSDFVTISDKGLLTAKEVTGDKRYKNASLAIEIPRD